MYSAAPPYAREGTLPTATASTLSVVVPAFNEEEVLPEFHRRLTAVLETLELPLRDPVRQRRQP